MGLGSGCRGRLGRLFAFHSEGNTTRQQAELVRMHATGDYTIAELTEVFSIGRATVYRVLDRAVPGPGAGTGPPARPAG